MSKLRIGMVLVAGVIFAVLVCACPNLFEKDQQQTVATPVFSPGSAEVFLVGDSVAINCDTDGATIYYTTDGNNPTTSSNQYSSPIVLQSDITIKAFAVKDGMNDSAVASGDFRIGTAGDLDGDGLSNNDEEGYGTSPTLWDTDGDGLSDYREIIELCFDADSNPYKFNPLIVDLPHIDITLESAPVITLDMSSSETSSTQLTTGTESEYSNTVTNSQSHSTSTAVEFSISKKQKSVGISGLIEIPVGPATKSKQKKTTEEETFSWSQEQSSTNSNAYSQSQSISQEKGFTYDGGEMKITVSVENTGDIAYTLENLTLSALELNPFFVDMLRPVGNLELDSSWSQFPETTLGPNDTITGLVFTKTDLDLTTAQSLWRNSRGLAINPTMYELTNAEGDSFNHNLTDVMARTATIHIDYGPNSSNDSEYYKVATNMDPDNFGITADKALSDILDITYTTDTNGCLDGVRGVSSDTAGTEWIVHYYYTDGGSEESVVYMASAQAYNFADIEIKSGNVLQLIYMNDSDNDGLYAREEFLYGTDSSVADSDGDSIDDGTEVYGNEVTGVARGGALISTNPMVSDTDNDGTDDATEITNGTDPASKFPLTEDITNYNDEIRDVAVDSYGNVYAVGQSNYTNSGYYPLGNWSMKKYASDGTEDHDWDITWDGLGLSADAAEAVTIGPDGAVYVAGYFSEQYNMAFEENWHIARLYPSGLEDDNWDISVDVDDTPYPEGTATDDRAQDIAVDSNGNVYVVGYGENLAGSDSGKDWWVKKFYSDGTEDTDWEQILDTGGLDDEAVAIAIDGNNNVIVAGYSTNTDGSSGKDWRIVKYTSLGNESWNETYAVSSPGDDVVRDIVVDSDNNIFAAGYRYSSQTGKDWHIKKLSSNGTEEWPFTIGSQAPGTVNDSAYGVALDTVENLFVTGYMNTQDIDWRIMRLLSSDGSQDSDWCFNKNISGYDIAHSIAVSDDGEVYAAGYSNGGSGNSGWHIRKYYSSFESTE